MIAGASIIIGDLTDPHNQYFLRGHDDQITCLAVSNSGALLATGQRGDNSDIIIWDYESKKAIFRLSEHDNAVQVLEFSHDDRILISVGSSLDGKMFLWDTANGYIISSKVVTPTLMAETPVAVCSGGMVKDVKLRDTNQYQFVTAGAGKLFIWALDPPSGATNETLIPTGSY